MSEPPVAPALSAPALLTRSSAFLLARIGAVTRERFGALLEPMGLNPRLFGVINVVSAEPGIIQQRLGHALRIDPSTMVALLDELEALGLVERRAHPDDRRARAVHLTAKGRATLRRARERAGALQEEILAPLAGSEREALHALLVKLVAPE